AWESVLVGADDLARSPGDNLGEYHHADGLLDEPDRAITHQEVGAAGVERVDLARPLRAVVRVGEALLSDILAVGSVQRAEARDHRAVEARSVDAEVARRSGPSPRIDAVGQGVSG